MASHEIDADSGKEESIIATSDSEEGNSASEIEQNEQVSSLASDSQQYEHASSPYQIILTACWPAVARRSMQHVQSLRNHCLLFGWCLNAFTLLLRSDCHPQRDFDIQPRSYMMTTLHLRKKSPN